MFYQVIASECSHTLYLHALNYKEKIMATITAQPPAPPDGPSDWTNTVQGNSFSNLDRLGQWTGGTESVPSGSDPSKSFQQVEQGSLGGGANPPTIYVLSHGWSPGYRAMVNSQGGNVLWWGANASVNNLWTSDWAWAPVIASVNNQTFPVNSNGLLPSIAALDSEAVILAWSWIDDSATESGDLKLDEVYSSEAYTHVNGIRLANALEQAIDPSFWNEQTGLLHLIGHSHGSKVATVAALTLQQRGRRVAHLTILDAPESELTLEGNAANLLGFYLEQMQIENPSYDCASGAFVDNYASCFGVSYAGTTNLKNIVEVALQPKKIYGDFDYSDQHGYAAAWYGGAAAGAAAQGEPPLGLAWPPPPKTYLPALNQNWPTGTNEFSQWQLQSGPSIHDSYSYSMQPLSISTLSMQGNVQGDPSTKLIFKPASGAWPAYSIFQGSYDNSPDSDNYGIAFDIVWTAPQAGDYLVVTMESPELGEQETLLVMDGQSYPGGKTSVAINSDVSSWLFSLYMNIYFLAAEGNTIGQVALSNFNFVVVGSASGYLRARRLAAAAEKTVQRSLSAPREQKLGSSAL
jgi:pimeloyl-ACP methyl ester carboxylesterase